MVYISQCVGDVEIHELEHEFAPYGWVGMENADITGRIQEETRTL
jgi:hypothetical protein